MQANANILMNLLGTLIGAGAALAGISLQNHYSTRAKRLAFFRSLELEIEKNLEDIHLMLKWLDNQTYQKEDLGTHLLRTESWGAFRTSDILGHVTDDDLRHASMAYDFVERANSEISMIPNARLRDQQTIALEELARLKGIEPEGGRELPIRVKLLRSHLEKAQVFSEAAQLWTKGSLGRINEDAYIKEREKLKHKMASLLRPDSG